jgi:CheY-like chemotaxis protein
LVRVVLARKPVVLVVDDSASVADSLALLIGQSGYDAIPARSGHEALDIVAGIAVDIAVVDIQLPGIDGLQTAVEICKRLPNCKIVLISGQPESIKQLERAARDGLHFPVLAKPIPPAELLATLESLRPSPMPFRPLLDFRPPKKN